MTGLEWIRCRNCKKALLRGHLEGDTIVEIKCERCATINTVVAEPLGDRLEPDGMGGFALKAVVAK